MSDCREIILRQINDVLVPNYGHRIFFDLPAQSTSPVPERAAQRNARALARKAERNPGQWPKGFDFSSLSDEELVAAFERIIRRSAVWM